MIKVNVDDAEDLARTLKITAMPVLAFKNGEKPRTIYWCKDANLLKTLLKRNIIMETKDEGQWINKTIQYKHIEVIICMCLHQTKNLKVAQRIVSIGQKSLRQMPGIIKEEAQGHKKRTKKWM